MKFVLTLRLAPISIKNLAARAFCNPADVETFTEEIKESLLTKRHGKGADFVRAVREIVDRCEKKKKQEQVSNDNSSDVISVPNASKSAESLMDSRLKDEASAVMVNSCPKIPYSTRAKNNPSSTESAAATRRKAALRDAEMPSEDPTGNFGATETPLPTTYSLSRKLEFLQPKSIVTQKRAPSARRSRSSAEVDPSRSQNSLLPSSHGGSCAGDTAATVLRDGYVRKNKLIRKPSNVAEGHDSESAAFVSNGSIEENGSEIASVDSDTLSFNEGSTLESACELLQPEYVVECREGDVEFNQSLDFAVVVKKKRKPNRKRASNDTSELNARLDREAAIENKVYKTEQISPRDLDELNSRHSKEEGDEHLPLVKRARVRMGRPSSAGEELDTLVRAEEKSSEVPNCISDQGCTPLICEEDSPVKNSSSVKRDAVGSSPSNKGPVNKPQAWELKKHQLFSCSVDGEAALPPSKRLHRALEAMSANAAEDLQTSSEAPTTMKTINNGCSFSSLGDCTNISMEGKAETEFGSSASQDASGTMRCQWNDRADTDSKSFTEVAACTTPFSGNNGSKHVSVDSAEGKDLSVSSLGTRTAEIVVVQSPKVLSPILGGKQACLECDHGSVLSNDDCKTQNSELSKPCKEFDPLELSRKSSNPVAGDVRILIASPPNDTNLLLHTAEGECCETTKLWNPPSDKNIQDNEKSKVLKGTEPILKDSSNIPSPTPVKVMMSAVQGPHLSHSTIFSEDHLGDKAVSCIQPSSTPRDGLNSVAMVSPRNTLIYNRSTPDNSNSLENNGCYSPEVPLHHEKLSPAGKWSNRAEGNSALASFEAILGTLTRTKEIIGRATRIAIDCAKFGSAAKVVEILVRRLERESSLHRRVDLFFLVDSIAQCSRSLKGDVSCIYPSAIQAVLPRILLAAAPPGSSSQENHRQCLKVLRVWQERRILPEFIIRRHIRELDSVCSSSSTDAFCRRPLRTERAFDDPIREMEGMLVDEYGSNSSFQLPGFHMPTMLKDDDEGRDSDGEGFEAVTPEHNSEIPEELESIPMPAVEKHRHILEDVDGELEMEDVAPTFEGGMRSISDVTGVNTAQIGHPTFEQHFPPPFPPPLLKNVPPPFCPPLPTSPPPPPPPLPPTPSVPLPLAILDSVRNGLDSKLCMNGQNINHEFQESIAQQSFATRIYSTISDGVQYRAPEGRDRQLHIQRQIPDSVDSCSFSCARVPHPQIQVGNGFQQSDGAALDNNAFHLRPPHPAPSNQFSYFQTDQQRPLQREIPLPSYPNRFHSVQNTEGRNFYSDHDRMKLAPHDIGPCHPDSARMPYVSHPYGGPPCQPAMANHRWVFPPQALNHRVLIPHRRPSEAPIPVATRAPDFWRPR
ncbi:unnamed protein product [Ilex paraguariensis]|uniref:CID domain-containing protein n=1 Tax=Ilex paraguariensis TaxID=185542 RepID=A0ABC8U317_9AQUA